MEKCRELTGLTVNWQKSSLRFSPSVHPRFVRWMSKILRVNTSLTSWKYLGLPISGQDLSKQRRLAVQEAVSRKLQDWKGRLLSMAGRCVLDQAVLNALPQHYMLSAAVPISATMDIERAARSFLWNGATSQSKIHTVSWEVITRPKTEGGLGLRRLPLLREAMLGTLAFRFIVSSSVTSSFFALKYKWNGNSWEVEETRKASQVWRSNCQGIKLIRPLIGKIPDVLSAGHILSPHHTYSLDVALGLNVGR
ncbi:hypothetical protein QJS04_geneDACA023438 [Acorus gramineus]|uniref:Reverse transcriptase n=1 Tax=Acorus gramineus TaxID=55184 RepID=A0AAV9A7F6_ACOGR|nr:hypothetical protein QJS04_geneDACA023438 [Acorus gramineus]